MWDGRKWERIGNIEAGRERWSEFLVVGNVTNIRGKEIKIRLRSIPMFYEINKVFVDYSVSNFF